MGRRRGLTIGVLILFWLTFFWQQIAGGQVWYCCDNLLVNVPSKVFLASELKEGRFPLWNPYIFSGTPFFADINLAALHPLNLLYFVLPPFQALTAGILILFLVGLVGMYVLGRTLGLGRFASLVGAVVFGFSGSLVVYANNIPILQVAVLVPWMLASWVRGNLVLFVLGAAFQFFSGHPQFTYYTWLVLAAYSWKRPWSLLKAGIIVLIITAPQLLPFLAFAFSSTRPGADFAVVSSDSVNPLSLIRLVLPGIVGNLSRGSAWIQAGTIHGYVGFLPLFFAPLAWHTKTGRFFLSVAVFSIFMAMGKYTPVYHLAYRVIPGVSWFREPVQTLFLWEFGVAGAAMVAVDSLVRKPRSVWYLGIVGSVYLLGAGALATMDTFTTPKPSPASLPHDLVYNLALFGVIGLLGGITMTRLRWGLAKIMVLSLVFVDLYVYGQTNVTTIASGTVTGWYETTRARIASWNLDRRYRYYTDPLIYPYPDKKPFGQFNDPGESQWQFSIVRPTLGMLYGLSAVDGYASMVSASYQKQFGDVKTDPTGVVIPSVVHPLLPKLGVRYLITKRNNSLLSDTTRYRLIADEGRFAVYEDTRAILTPAKETER